MNVPLSQAGEVTVQAGVIDATGWVIGVGGLLLTVFWLRSLFR